MVSGHAPSGEETSLPWFIRWIALSHWGGTVKRGDVMVELARAGRWRLPGPVFVILVSYTLAST